jgi:hypothetical protein
LKPKLSHRSFEFPTRANPPNCRNISSCTKSNNEMKRGKYNDQKGYKDYHFSQLSRPQIGFSI